MNGRRLELPTSALRTVPNASANPLKAKAQGPQPSVYCAHAGTRVNTQGSASSCGTDGHKNGHNGLPVPPDHRRVSASHIPHSTHEQARTTDPSGLQAHQTRPSLDLKSYHTDSEAAC